MWRSQYKAVTSRLLAMDHLVKPIPNVERITGKTDPIVAGYTEGERPVVCYMRGTWISVDRVLDPITATAQEIKDISKEKHIGSPTSIIFLTGDQRQLWGETRLLLLGDYSTGFSHFKITFVNRTCKKVKEICLKDKLLHLFS